MNLYDSAELGLEKLEGQIPKEQMDYLKKILNKGPSNSKTKTSKPGNNRGQAESIDQILSELRGMTGLESVKNDVESLVHSLAVDNLRKEHNLKVTPISKHMVFTGNPGTGKTTVARIIARIYKDLGIIEKNDIVETDRAGLVAGYIGQTALKTKKVIDSAMGGILFIDEAYTLSSGNSTRDFGQEAIDTLLKAMEDNRDKFIVIVAGYPDLMEKFINSNPGLKSRFNNYLRFEDYNAEELEKIFKSMCTACDYCLDENLEIKLKPFFENMVQNKPENFANAREARNLFEKMRKKQADRIVKITAPTKEELKTLTLDDLEGLSLETL